MRPTDPPEPTGTAEPQARPEIPHDCMDFRRRVTLNEGDDVIVERCDLCGKIRMERGDGVRPMAWFRAPSKINPSFPWRYAYDDPRPGREGDPDIWKLLEEIGHAFN